jgi:hypothetical protein
MHFKHPKNLSFKVVIGLEDHEHCNGNRVDKELGEIAFVDSWYYAPQSIVVKCIIPVNNYIETSIEKCKSHLSVVFHNIII